MVVGRDEGPFSAPKALEAPMGELGLEPGALSVSVESTGHQRHTRFTLAHDILQWVKGRLLHSDLRTCVMKG